MLISKSMPFLHGLMQANLVTSKTIRFIGFTNAGLPKYALAFFNANAIHKGFHTPKS